MKRDHLGRPEIRWVIDSECDNHEIRYGGDELFSYLHAIPADAPLPEGCEEVCIMQRLPPLIDEAFAKTLDAFRESIPPEFAAIEEFDALIEKWRGYIKSEPFS